MLCVKDKEMLSQARASMLYDELYGGKICGFLEVKKRTYTLRFGAGRVVRKGLSGEVISKFWIREKMKSQTQTRTQR